MAYSINRITNCRPLVNGRDLLGKVAELTLPDVKQKMVEHQALGLIGTVEYPSGLEKMEAKFKFSSLYPDVVPIVADPFRAANIQVRGNLETWQGQTRTNQVAAVIYLTGSFQNLPLGGFKPKDNVEYESTMSVSAIKLVVAGVELVEVDVANGVYKVNGVDLYAQHRLNTGG
jgi:P2 family phage contractile tail tube protein